MRCFEAKVSDFHWVETQSLSQTSHYHRHEQHNRCKWVVRLKFHRDPLRQNTREDAEREHVLPSACTHLVRNLHVPLN
jgi:hypothetical protein